MRIWDVVLQVRRRRAVEQGVRIDVRIPGPGLVQGILAVHMGAVAGPVMCRGDGPTFQGVARVGTRRERIVPGDSATDRQSVV
jgi:hypothetical protein